MPLDPVARRNLELRESLGIKETCLLSVAEAREQVASLIQRGAGEPVASVENRTIPRPDGGDLGVRIYRPEAPAGILVYFHGSGFVLCSLDTHDAICRRLTNATSCTVVSVDYRLAPEHRYPAGAEDCYAATKWASEHTAELCHEGAKIAVAGDSAGGNMAAVVPVMARDRGGPAIALQVLQCPVIEFSFDRPSHKENAEGFGLTTRTMRWYWGHYLGDDTSRGLEPYASPSRAADLAGVAPALIITAEFDVLRDEAEAYAQRLWECGVPAVCTRYLGMTHAFAGMFLTMEAARLAVVQMADAIRTAVGA
jgi:acetyl esterase